MGVSVPPKQPLSQDDYDYLRQKGYSDAQIEADGFELPAGGARPTPTPTAPRRDASVGDEVAGGLLSALQGASFGLADEAVGLVSPEARARMNATREGFEERHPVARWATEIGGGMLTGGALAGGLKAAGTRGVLALTGGAARTPAALRAAQALQYLTQSLPAQGAVIGGVAGAGNAEPGSRMAGAGKGAAAGAVLAPVIGAAVERVGVPAARALTRAGAPVVRKGREMVADVLGRGAGRASATATPASGPIATAPSDAEARAFAYLSRLFQREGMTPQQLGAQLEIATDADPRYLLNLGKQAVNVGAKVTQAIPSRATTIVPERLRAQNEAGVDRVEAALEKAVGRRLGDYQTRYQELADEAAAAAKPHYDALRNTALDIHAEDAPEAAKLLANALERPAGRAAYEQALTNIRNMGRKAPEVQAWTVELDPAAGVGIQTPAGTRSTVTVGMMDDVKKVLDLQIQALEDAIASGQVRGPQLAKMQSELPGLRAVRRDIVDSVDELTGNAYQQARAQAAPGLQRREAYREGHAAPLQSEGAVLNAPNRTAAPETFGEGYAQRIIEQIRKAREPQSGLTGYIQGLVDSPAARSKLQMAIPDAGVADQLALEQRLLQQAREANLMRGSQTAPVGAGVIDAKLGEAGQVIEQGARALQNPMRLATELGMRGLLDRFGGGLNEEASGLAGDLLTSQLRDPRLQQLAQYWFAREAQRAAAQAAGQRMGGRVAGTLAGRIGGQ